MIIRGDCLEKLKEMPDNSVDSIVTDPPAGISFMSKTWDDDKGGRDHWIAWLAEIMLECKRVLKPGGHALVWGLPRTSHWTATAVENAGFQIRDIITHHFGSGFPKSHDVYKALIKADVPVLKYKGFGTSLKPASEHWILARKPLEGTVAANVEKWGCGGLNIDASRVGTDTRVNQPAGSYLHNESVNDGRSKEVIQAYIDKQKSVAPTVAQGRWPANLILDEEAAEDLDTQAWRDQGYRWDWELDSKGNKFHFQKIDRPSRFFKVFAHGKNDQCQNQNASENADTAKPILNLDAPEAYIALEAVLKKVDLEDKQLSVLITHFTNDILNWLKNVESGTIEKILNTAQRFLLELRLIESSKQSPVKNATLLELTDIITTIHAHLTFSGYAGVATSRFTPKSLEHGEKDSKPSKFLYCAKASKSERNAGLDSFVRVVSNVEWASREDLTAAVQLLQKVTSALTVKWLIGENGKSISAQCPKECKSTISTAIKQIMESQILSALIHSLINENTQDASLSPVNGGSLAVNAASLKPWLLNITKGKMVLALGASRVANETLLRISESEDWPSSSNFHSTVKPLKLMEYLIRLITPPNGTVLDPFCGSGSTLVAAKRLGFKFIGIELDEAYAEIAERRVANVR